MARLVPIFVGVVGLLALGQWLMSRAAPSPLTARLPGADNEQMVVPPVVDLTGQLTRGSASLAPYSISGQWPGFRGIRRDAISTETMPLVRSFPEHGPRRLWSVELAEGYAGAAVRDGRVYVMDYDAQAQADTLRCLSLATGAEIWRRAYRIEIGRNHGITRTVPAVTDRYVVTMGPKCHVVCVDAITGEYRWGVDLVEKYKTVVPEWYAGQCPLIDGDRVILAPGGEKLMVALNLADGSVAWETPNPRKWKMTHSSITPMDFGGRRTYVYCGSGGVAGVSGEDGGIIWDSTDWKVTMATVPSPVIVGEDRIFLTGGYGAGSMMIRLTSATQASPLQAVVGFRLKPEVFGADQHTPILYNGHLYGIIPGGRLACLDLDGKRLWASGGKDRFGLGPFMIADGMILALSETGALTLVEATPEAYRPIAQTVVFEDGHEAWGPMALVAGRLICRDLTRMVCVDLRRDGHD